MKKKIPLFDAHCDTLTECVDKGKSLYTNDLAVDLKRLGCFSPAVQVMAVYFGEKKNELSYFKKCARFLKKERSARVLRTAADFDALDLPGVILAVEGAEVLEGELSNVELLAECGVKILTLTWNLPNGVSTSFFYEGGLSNFGRELIPELSKYEILADLSHSNDESFWDVMELSARPVIASHSNARKICPHRRNLTDEQFLALKKSGGGAGINLAPEFLTLDEPKKRRAELLDVFAHIEHFLSLGGEKSLFLGCDMDGISRYPKGLSGVECLSNLYEYLLKKNYPENLVKDIFYDNLKEILFKFMREYAGDF